MTDTEKGHDMSGEELHGQPVLNTDRELYREDTGDSAGSYYENSVHVTQSGAIGMNVGGTVIVQPIADWHRDALAARGITGFGPDGPRYATPADVTGEPVGGQELREAIARGLYGLMGYTRPWSELEDWRQEKWRGDADPLLALPELAALIADAERVRRVRELHTADADGGCGGCWDGCWHCDSDHAIEDCATRRALDGEPQP